MSEDVPRGVAGLVKAAAKMNALTARARTVDRDDPVRALLYLLDYERAIGNLAAELSALISERLADMVRESPDAGVLFAAYRLAPEAGERVASAWAQEDAE